MKLKKYFVALFFLSKVFFLFPICLQPWMNPMDFMLAPVISTRYCAPVEQAILGAAVGDAMGRPTEFIYDVDKILAKYPNGLRSFTDFKQNDFIEQNGKKNALYTDDTAMAKIVLDVLIKATKLMPPTSVIKGGLCVSFTPEKRINWPLEKIMGTLAEEFVKDMNRKDGWAAGYRAPGSCCLKGCKKLEKILLDKKNNPEKYQGKKWWRVGGKSDGGCGSVMRAYPFGLIFADDVQKAEEFAVEHSRLTHGADLALAACAAMAVGISSAINSSEWRHKDYQWVIEAMIKTAKKYDSVTAEKMEDAYAQALVNKKKCKTFQDMLTISRPVFEKYLGWAAHDAIAATIYVFAMCPEDIQSAIALGVNTPGDSDSIATMAGALVGAYGRSKLPQQWIDIVENSLELQTMASQVSGLFLRWGMLE